MEGDVKVKSEKSDVWISAEKGMVLIKGDNLKTGERSWAEIGFGKGFKNSVRVQENTVFFAGLGEGRASEGVSNYHDYIISSGVYCRF